jgi:hypothetical protein
VVFYLVLVIIAVGFIRPVSNFSLLHGDSVSASSESILEALRSAFLDTSESCRFIYKSQSGSTVELTLAQDFFDGPWMVIPSKEQGVFLCFYNFDVSYPLFRIDTKAEFSPPKPSADARLREIVSSSQSAVSMANAADLEEAIAYLRNSAPTEVERHSFPRFGFYRPQLSPPDITQIIAMMKRDSGR